MFGFYLDRLLLAAGVVSLFVILHVCYNLYLHPLRSFPGPWYTKSSIAWFVYHGYKGDHWSAVHELHLKYGPVVRIAPDELSFTEARAWKDIYGHRQGIPEFPKDSSQTFTDDPAHPHIIAAPREQHSKLRKLLSHGFSEKALREQEGVLNTYAMKLINALRSRICEPVDLVKWYNFTTFDVIGHLVFAESFDCLESSSYHRWVDMIFSTLKFLTWTRVLGRAAPGYVNLLLRLIPKRTMRERNATRDMTEEKLLRRKERSVEYIDFAANLLNAEQKGIIDTQDLMSNLPVLVVAGSETTATALSGITFYVLTHPRVYARLVGEIRTNIRDHSEINSARISELKYLHAVIDEGIRLYPPANSNHPRVLPPQGATICGRYVLGGTLVGIPHYGCFRSPYNFADPEEFIPERSLNEDARYAHDKREAIQPFHVGPRNCIGRSLAFIEMRLILAHVLLEFDIMLEPELEEWNKQEVYSTWLKKPLKVQLRPAAKTY
ncbi:putative cytochrome P450 monooxygenase [Annulohypoxylon nitens]|nr:putative cytochrome P450 monooxygenase [Annulohypoxylon nitens]